MVSIQDVAAHAGVSVATVSRALRGLPNVADATRQRVQQAARELDYVADPAAAWLAGRRSGNVGVVVPSFGAWYSSALVSAIHQVTIAAGHDALMMVVSDAEDHARFLRDLPFRKRVDGLVLVDVPLDDEQFDRVLSAGVPLVATGSRSSRVSTVGIDDRAAAREAVELLIELGHTEIAVIEGATHDAFAFAAPTERHDGVQDAVDDAGGTVATRHVVHGDWRGDGGRAAMLDLVTHDVPTAVFCFSDEMAIGAIGALRSCGLRVPEDVSVVGFDGHELAAHVGLTTIAQPVHDIGQRAAQQLLHRIATPDAPVQHEILPTQLVVRDSAGRVREHDIDPIDDRAVGATTN